MIFVIMPLGEAARQVFGWLVQVCVYVLASVVGGATTGLVFSFLGVVLLTFGAFWLAAPLALLAFAYALRELGLLTLPMPNHAWQVPNSWQRRSRLLGSLAFGFTLGAGVFTFIEFSSLYILLGWEAATALPAVGALLGAVFGLTRGLPVLLGGIATLTGKNTIKLNIWILNDAARALHLLDGALLLFVAAFLLGMAL